MRERYSHSLPFTHYSPLSIGKEPGGAGLRARQEYGFAISAGTEAHPTGRLFLFTLHCKDKTAQSLSTVHESRMTHHESLVHNN
jgi:hypothetical protein